MKINLENVFTSGDSYTVLTLIDKLIATIKKGVNAVLYMHEIRFQDISKRLRIFSFEKEPCVTYADIVTAAMFSIYADWGLDKAIDMRLDGDSNLAICILEWDADQLQTDTVIIDEDIISDIVTEM